WETGNAKPDTGNRQMGRELLPGWPVSHFPFPVSGLTFSFSSRGAGFPEVIVHPEAFVILAKRQLHRHVDLDPFGVAVGHLDVHAAATLEIDDRMCDGRVGRIE